MYITLIGQMCPLQNVTVRVTFHMKSHNSFFILQFSYYQFVLFFLKFPTLPLKENYQNSIGEVEKLNVLATLYVLMVGTNFVKKSAHMEVDGVNFKFIFFSSIRSFRKWCLIDICLIFLLIRWIDCKLYTGLNFILNFYWFFL